MCLIDGFNFVQHRPAIWFLIDFFHCDNEMFQSPGVCLIQLQINPKGTFCVCKTDNIEYQKPNRKADAELV